MRDLSLEHAAKTKHLYGKV